MAGAYIALLIVGETRVFGHIRKVILPLGRQRMQNTKQAEDFGMRGIISKTGPSRPGGDIADDKHISRRRAVFRIWTKTISMYFINRVPFSSPSDPWDTVITSKDTIPVKLSCDFLTKAVNGVCGISFSGRPRNLESPNTEKAVVGIVTLKRVFPMNQVETT